MKIAITSTGKELTSEVDPRFGRAKYFIIVDMDHDDTVSVVDNVQNLNAMQGAGIQSAKNVIESGAKAVVSGNMGPKAFGVLNDNDIDMYVNATGTVEEALEKFKAGELTKVDNPNVEGHWV